MSFICTDQGASNTRYVVNGSKVFVNPNNGVFVGIDDDIRLDKSTPDILDNLDIVIEKVEGKTDFFPQRVLMGSMAERYSSSQTRPSMMMNKSQQMINYVSILLACAIGQLNTGFDDDVNLAINLPPVEISPNEDYVKEQLVGTWSVKFNKMDNAVAKFKIATVRIFPESVAAAFAFFFKPNGEPRMETNVYRKGYVLSIDIGASTSDLAMIKDGQYMNRTGTTYKIGGNVITDIMRSKVRSLYGTELTDDDANTLVIEGRLPYGSKYKDMSKELADAKKEFADMLFEYMSTYFNTVRISLNNIKAIFVSGGGSMKSQYYDLDSNEEVETTPSVSYYLTEKLKNICDGVDVVEYPGDNPRMANIIGTTTFTAASARKK